MKPLLIVLCLFILSCQKDPYPYMVASKGAQVEWHVQTHCYTQIVIDGWGTAQVAYKDSLYCMDAFKGNRNIYGLKYKVSLFTDSWSKFTDAGIVQHHNDIIDKEQ